MLDLVNPKINPGRIKLTSEQDIGDLPPEDFQRVFSDILGLMAKGILTGYSEGIPGGAVRVSTGIVEILFGFHS